MFGFLKSKFVAAATFFSCNALKCISINKAKVFNIMSKSNETRHIYHGSFVITHNVGNMRIVDVDVKN